VLLLPTAYALVVAGFDFAVAALCWGWPRGELWPLGTRLTSIAMALAGLTSIAAGMLMAGIAPELAMRALVALSIVSFVAGTACVIPSDEVRATRFRTWLGLVGIPVSLATALMIETLPAASTAVGVPQRVLTLPSAVLFALGPSSCSRPWPSRSSGRRATALVDARPGPGVHRWLPRRRCAAQCPCR
jgi:hypothetical protein